jgi:hypothetical protein
MISSTIILDDSSHLTDYAENATILISFKSIIISYNHFVLD